MISLKTAHVINGIKVTFHQVRMQLKVILLWRGAHTNWDSRAAFTRNALSLQHSQYWGTKPWTHPCKKGIACGDGLWDQEIQINNTHSAWTPGRPMLMIFICTSHQGGFDTVFSKVRNRGGGGYTWSETHALLVIVSSSLKTRCKRVTACHWFTKWLLGWDILRPTVFTGTWIRLGVSCFWSQLVEAIWHVFHMLRPVLLEPKGAVLPDSNPPWRG